MSALRIAASTAVLAVVVHGCSSSPRGPHLAKDDVAVVGTTHITKSAYAQLLEQADAIAASTAARNTSRAIVISAVMTRLVANAALANAASASALTVNQLRAGIEARAHVTVADRDSFTGFLSGSGPPRAREVRYLVLDDHALARKLFSRLIVGNDAAWCALAKYSLDHGSRDRCGTAPITNGELVRQLDRLVFSAKQNVPSLVHTDNGYWTIVETLGQVEQGGSQRQVDAMLLLQRQTVLVGAWEAAVNRLYCTGISVSYRHGYEADPDPTHCAAAERS